MSRISSVRAAMTAALVLASACTELSDRPSSRAMAALTAELVPARAEAHTAPPQRPTPPRERVPPIVRGIYVSSYAAGNPVSRGKLLALTDSTELNSWVVDVKDEDGVRFHSKLPLAREASHWGSIRVHDLRALADTLKAHDIYPIARVVVFKDPRLSRARPDWSIQTPGRELWRDHQRITWVSPWDRRVWEYNIQVAEEAARAGFREIQFDYVRFPEAYRSLPTQVHPQAAGERGDAIAAFLAEATRRLRPLGVTVTADVFGLSMNESKDVGIGQQWEQLSSRVDGLLPMVYPSHYFPTHLAGVPRPNRMPYETVFRSVGMGVIRNQRLADAGRQPARIVPWLQAFTATWNDRSFKYGPQQAADQIRAVHDLGLEDWIFWHPTSKYDAVAGAFARESLPRARRFTPPASLVRMVDRFDREGAAAIRERETAGPSQALGQ
ncbi:MAG TPA: putative glycoside hydrolase [Longimicrobium sp.]|jgi:hypothetical protein